MDGVDAPGNLAMSPAAAATPFPPRCPPLPWLIVGLRKLSCMEETTCRFSPVSSLAGLDAGCSEYRNCSAAYNTALLLLASCNSRVVNPSPWLATVHYLLTSSARISFVQSYVSRMLVASLALTSWERRARDTNGGLIRTVSGGSGSGSRQPGEVIECFSLHHLLQSLYRRSITSPHRLVLHHHCQRPSQPPAPTPSSPPTHEPAALKGRPPLSPPTRATAPVMMDAMHPHPPALAPEGVPSPSSSAVPFRSQALATASSSHHYDGLSSSTHRGPGSGSEELHQQQTRFPSHPHHSQLSMTGSTAPLSHNARPESISTLWSSADVPLFLDSYMERKGSNASYLMGSSRGILGTPRGMLSAVTYETDNDLDEREELTSDRMDGPRSVSSPPSSDCSEFAAPGEHPRKPFQLALSPPPPLSRLSPTPPGRDMLDPNMPISVSHASHLTMATQRSADSHNTLKVKTSPPAAPVHLYQEAERYFSKSYSLSPTSPTQLALPRTPAMMSCSQGEAQLANATPHLLRSRFSDAGTEDGMVDVVSPPYSGSRDSKSSAESSLTLPELEEGGSHHTQTSTWTSFAPSSLTKSVLSDGPSSPLRAAVGLSVSHSMAPRPRTSDATSTISPTKAKPLIRHVHTSSDQELLRRMKSPSAQANGPDESDQAKYDFLDSPAPTPTPRKLTLFGAKLRAVSTPRLRAAKLQEPMGANSKEEQREIRPHPPQAPSGRFRSRTLGEADHPGLVRGESGGSSSGRSNMASTPAEEAPAQRPRRPSSTEAIAAAARRLRRPSKAGTMSSSHYNSSVMSLNNQSDVYGTPKSTVAFTTGSNGSQVNLEAGGRAVSSMTTLANNGPKRTVLRTQSSSGILSRPKSKGGWASHLSQGLSLHVEQGSRRHVIKMNYLSYDPFGKPESLCMAEERPITPRRPKSKSGQADHDGSEDQVGLLEFGPSVEADVVGQLTLSSSLDDSACAPILKHLAIGDDSKGDLITRQANLSMAHVGTHEVSGSERKGKVAWRFVYSVEECWNASGQLLEGVKTLRPVGFSCSATLLDPSRARKSRVINMIRKQMGSHIESMPTQAATSSGNAPTKPTLESPTSSHSSGRHQSPSQGGTSIHTTTTPSAAPTPPRPGLVPFKMSRPMVEALAARNRVSSERSSSSSTHLTSSSQAGPSMHQTHKTSLLPSPLSAHFAIAHREAHSPAAKSARELQQSSRLLSPQTDMPTTRPRGSSFGQSYRRPGGGALGLEVNDSTALRNRAVTTQVNLNRPPTASEEIKRAYLLQTSRSDQTVAHCNTNGELQPPFGAHDIHDTNDTRHDTRHDTRYDTLHQQQQPPHAIIRHHHPHRPNTSQVDTREAFRLPVSSVSRKRQTQAPTASKFEAPEGPYWL